MPIVAVTTRGARSGKLRKNPVMRVTDGSAYAVVASKSGSDEHRASKSHRHRQLDKDKRRYCTRQDRVSSLIPIQSQLDSKAGPFSAHRKPFSRLAMSLRIGAITCA
jgi:hypothetical protein